MNFHFRSVAMTSALMMLTGTAFAASDYLLQLDAGKGDSVSAPATIEVQSFSWGASNPTSVASSGMSAGKVNVQDLSVTRVSAPRDVATGQASGKRIGAAAVVTPASVAPAVGEMRTVAVDLRESPSLGACATGKHFPKATLSGKGQSITLEDVVVSSCTVSGAMRRVEYTGHVTLMK
jgi:type VI protein secretion system component Hcp